MAINMNIYKLVEILKDFITDRMMIFTSIEEMIALGYNMMSLLLDLGPHIEYSALTLRYNIVLDELEPIAIVIHLRRDRVENINLSIILDIIRRYKGYIYGNQKNIGFLIPVDEERLYEVIAHIIPQIVYTLFGSNIKPCIVGYTLDLYNESKSYRNNSI